MEEFDALKTGLTTIRQIVPMLRSLLEKAPQEGASKEFTRQLNEAVINMQQAVIDAQEMVLAGQATEAKLRSRLQDLEQQTARAKNGPEEISHYRLVTLPRNGGMAFALREELSNEDNPCITCVRIVRKTALKAFLQYTGMSIKPYDCPRCPR